MATIGPFPIAEDNLSIGPFPVDTEARWNDINMPINTAKQPGTNNPDDTAFTTNLNLYTFAVNAYVDLASQEMLHGYYEGTDIEPHLHIITNGLEAVDTKVKFTFYYWIANVNGTNTEQSTSVEITIPANTPDRTHLLKKFDTDITGTGFKIGTCVNGRLKRVAKSAGGADPAANPFVVQIGLHYQVDSVGSRTHSTK